MSKSVESQATTVMKSPLLLLTNPLVSFCKLNLACFHLSPLARRILPFARARARVQEIRWYSRTRPEELITLKLFLVEIFRKHQARVDADIISSSVGTKSVQIFMQLSREQCKHFKLQVIWMKIANTYCTSNSLRIVPNRWMKSYDRSSWF